MTDHHRTSARKTPARYFCVVTSQMAREQVDPRAAELLKEHGLPTTKIGDFRKLWRKRHCATINPHGFEDCPYSERDCVLAYYTCITRSIASARDNPVGYFWAAAKSLALIRADNKPLERESGSQGPRNPGTASPGSDPGHRGVDETSGAVSGSPREDELDHRLHGRTALPVHIRTLLGQIDLGPREGRAPDGAPSEE